MSFLKKNRQRLFWRENKRKADRLKEINLCAKVSFYFLNIFISYLIFFNFIFFTQLGAWFLMKKTTGSLGTVRCDVDGDESANSLKKNTET